MESASGWGKPIKKVKDTSAHQNTTASTATSTQQNPSTSTVPKINTKSEPFVQKTVLKPIQVTARAREGLYLIDDQDNNFLSDASKLICDDATLSLFSGDGKILAFANPMRIGVFNLADQSGDIYDLPNVLAMRFSPALNYLVTIDKRDTRHFITVFEAKTLKKIADYETVRYKKETWPQLKFVGEDELAFRSINPGKIDVLDPKQGFKTIKTIDVKPFDFFQVSPRVEGLLVVCVNLEHSAGYDKNEGRIEVYEYNNGTATPLATKVLDKAHEVNLFFSPTGQHLVAWTQTFTDKTGQSYYGEHALFHLDRANKCMRRVPTVKGPIHDVAWNPTGKDFIAISGFMPACSILYSDAAVPRFEFGQHHRNTIKWSPQSTFVCLAGFGNLSGDMDIWDTASLKKVGSCKSNTAVSCLWSPDGRRIMTGVLNPRLRVDNGYKIFKYNGEQLNSVDFSHTELYEVAWRPGQYEETPISPLKAMETKEEPKMAAFRPKGASGSFAAQLKAQKDTKTAGRFLAPDEIFGNEANIEVEEKNDQPKKKKRIRKKKDKNAEETKDDDDGLEEDEK